MALTQADLSIYGHQKTIPLLTSEQIQAQQETEDAKREQARKIREATLDDARLREAMRRSVNPQTGAPDYDQFIGHLGKLGASPTAIEAAQKMVDTHFTTQLANQKSRDEHNAAKLKFDAERIGAIDSQAKLDIAHELYPDLNLPTEYASGLNQIRLVAQSASTEAEKATARHVALEDAQKAKEWAAGTPERMAKGLAAAATFVANDSPDNYQAAVNGGLQGLGFDPAIVAQLPPQYDPQALARLSMTPKDTAELADKADERKLAAANTEADNKRADAALGISRAHLGIAQTELKLRQQSAAGAEGVTLKPGTPNYRQAQDLADGTLTFQDFQRLHSRAQADAPLRAAIYDTARQLNPNFNPSAFEIGFKFASNPKVRQQISSLKNVELGVDDLLKFSDKASRSNIPVLNKALQLGGVNLGGKSYSNFQTAVTAFADELSGALGYGSATDMSREMGFKMTDLSQSPDTFRSNIENVVLPFVARKKASIVGEMGPYAGGANPTGTAPAAKPADYIYDPKTGTLKKRGG